MIKQGSLAIVLLSFIAGSLGYTRHACSSPETSSLPYCDTTLPTSTRIQDLIPRLSTSEKVCINPKFIFPDLKGVAGFFNVAVTMTVMLK